jgi:hypothetical protein
LEESGSEGWGRVMAGRKVKEKKKEERDQEGKEGKCSERDLDKN